VLTSVAPPGTTVNRGGVLFGVADQPVRLLLGAIPAYREIGAGMADGPDVRQLERGLAALGLDPGHHIVVDNHFTSATQAAIKRWQAAWGWPASRRTGRLPLGQIAFLPVPVRVSGVQAAPGTAIGPNSPVLTATSTRQVVTAQVATDRQAAIRPGAQVLVTLPDGTTAPGTVRAVGTAPSQGTGDAPPTVPVTIVVRLPDGTRPMDQTPVQVGITTATHDRVLRVPVAALLARPGGGYEVRRDSGELVAVEPGLYDDATRLVEVTGAGLAEGQLVEVPAP
jgi:peptidoglycan hydrolase-like protein with peptidoglycan-binding domain